MKTNKVVPENEYSLLTEERCQTVCSKWLEKDATYFREKFDLEDMPYVAYFLQEQTRNDIIEWAYQAKIPYQSSNPKKENYISFERLAAIYNTTVARTLENPEPRFTRDYNDYQEINTPTAQNINFWHQFYAQQASNPSPNKNQDDNIQTDKTEPSKHTKMSVLEEKFLFLRCMQQATKNLTAANKQHNPVNNLEEAQQFYHNHPKVATQTLPVLSALSDMPALRNHVRATTKNKKTGETLLTLDRSAAYGTEKKDDAVTAKKLMQSMLYKWHTEDSSPDAEFLFLTVIQADSFERTIAANNITALKAIQEDCKRWQELHSATKVGNLTPEQEKAYQQEIDSLTKEYGEFSSCLSISPEKIRYANVRQRLFPSPTLNWLWDNIINPFIKVGMALFYPLPEFDDEQSLTTMLLEKLEQQCNKARKNLINSSNQEAIAREEQLMDSLFKKAIFTQLLQASPDPAHKSAALIVLAQQCGYHVNLTCKSGKDRTGCISALASSLQVTIEQEMGVPSFNRTYGPGFLKMWNQNFSHEETLGIQAQLSGQNSICARGIKSWTSILDFDPRKNPGLDESKKLQETLKFAEILANNNRYTYKKPKDYALWLTKKPIDEQFQINVEKISKPKKPENTVVILKPEKSANPNALLKPKFTIQHKHIYRRHKSDSARCSLKKPKRRD